MRAGSASPFFTAASTALTNSCTRRSIFGFAGPAGVNTFQPRSRVWFCHSAASAAASIPPSSAMAGGLTGAVCAAASGDKAPELSRLMAQASADLFDQFFDAIGFLERGHGKDVAVVLFQVRLQFFREIRQLGRVLQILPVLRFQNLFLLRFAVGHAHVRLVRRAGGLSPTAALRERNRRSGQEQEGRRTTWKPEFHGKTCPLIIAKSYWGVSHHALKEGEFLHRIVLPVSRPERCAA